MSVDQASILLTAGLPSPGGEVVAGLLEVTGRWPLLLRLVNGILADYARLASDTPDQAGAVHDSFVGDDLAWGCCPGV